MNINDLAKAQLGQTGSFYTDDTSNAITLTGGTSDIGTDIEIKAITAVTDTSFTTLTSVDNAKFLSSAAAAGIDGHCDAFASVVIPAGMTIYGRWSTFTLASGSVIAYLG